MAPWIIPAGMWLAGKLFSHKGESDRKKKEWEANRSAWEKEQARRSAKAQLMRRVLQGYGIGDADIDPALLDRLSQSDPFPAAPVPGWMETVGGGLSGLAPYVYQGLNKPKAPTAGVGADFAAGGVAGAAGGVSPASVDGGGGDRKGGV